MQCINCDYIGQDFKRHSFYNGIQRWVCPKCRTRSVNHLNEIDLDKIQQTVKEIEDEIYSKDEDVESSIKIKKYQDIANFEKRKSNELVRKYNVVESLLESILSTVSKYKYNDNKTPERVWKYEKNSNVGIIQISDVHFNELISLDHNKYDFEVASKRLNKLANEAINTFRTKNIKNVHVIFTGDLLNSDRRADEVAARATNRSVATVIASDIISKFLLDIASEYFVTVNYVVGNESRVGDELTFSEVSAYDNYDFLIMQMVKARLSSCSQINFVEPKDPNEDIISIGKINILALHGFNIKHNNMETSIQQLIGKYATQRILIDYVLLGHVHATRLGSNFARSASLCGANAYSDVFLGLSSRASQNIFVIDVIDQSIHATAVDLQNADGYSGYEFENLDDAYNPKSVRKTARCINGKN
jgi:predicted phosphodiesterase